MTGGRKQLVNHTLVLLFNSNPFHSYSVSLSLSLSLGFSLPRFSNSLVIRWHDVCSWVLWQESMEEKEYRRRKKRWRRRGATKFFVPPRWGRRATSRQARILFSSTSFLLSLSLSVPERCWLLNIVPDKRCQVRMNVFLPLPCLRQKLRTRRWRESRTPITIV